MSKIIPTNRWCSDTIEEYVDTIVKQKVLPLFKHKNALMSNDIGIDHGGIGKLNSIYLMKTDLLNGIDFKYPISITSFDKNNFVIHPGGTRMMFGEIYKKPIQIIVTDYTNTICERYPHIKFAPYQTMSYDFLKNPLTHIEVPSDHRYCPSAFDKALNPHLYNNVDGDSCLFGFVGHFQSPRGLNCSFYLLFARRPWILG
jgi:hypothetical protein